MQLSEFPDLLASRPVRSELVYVLVGLDKQYTAGGVETPWPEFYASQLVERFGAASRS